MKKKFLKKLVAAVGAVAIMGSSFMSQETMAASQTKKFEGAWITTSLSTTTTGGAKANTVYSSFNGTKAVLDISITYKEAPAGNLSNTTTWNSSNRKTLTSTAGSSSLTVTPRSGMVIVDKSSTHKITFMNGTSSETATYKNS